MASRSELTALTIPSALLHANFTDEDESVVMSDLIRSAMTRFGGFDLRLASLACQEVENRFMVALLRTVSRIGDGWLSLLTAAILLLSKGPWLAGRFAIASIVGLILQKALKRAFTRKRPCLLSGGPPQRVSIPDAGSFPSGHTLHAMLSFIVIAACVPTLMPPFMVFALLTGISRVALGVHYPSDVVAGGALGGVLAMVVCSV